MVDNMGSSSEPPKTVGYLQKAAANAAMPLILGTRLLLAAGSEVLQRVQEGWVAAQRARGVAAASR